MAEIFDVVDEENQVIGQAPREEVHAKLLRHRHVFIFIFNKDGQLLLQKRSMSKDLYPGLWTGSVSGHVHAGEAYETAALRELEEELDVKVQKKDLKLFKVMENIRGRDIGIDALFITHYDGPVTANAEEVDEYTFSSLEQVRKDIESGDREFTGGFKNMFKAYTESK